MKLFGVRPLRALTLRCGGIALFVGLGDLVVIGLTQGQPLFILLGAEDGFHFGVEGFVGGKGLLQHLVHRQGAIAFAGADGAHLLAGFLLGGGILGLLLVGELEGFEQGLHFGAFTAAGASFALAFAASWWRRWWGGLRDDAEGDEEEGEDVFHGVLVWVRCG